MRFVNARGLLVPVLSVLVALVMALGGMGLPAAGQRVASRGDPAESEAPQLQLQSDPVMPPYASWQSSTTHSQSIEQRLQAPTERITAVGDSVMLAAAEELTDMLETPLDLDAAVGRQAAGALEVLRSRRAEGALGSIVVVHIGHNGPVGQDELNEMMGLLADVPRVLVLNVNLPRPWMDANNAAFAALEAQYSNVQVLDWAEASRDHPELFWDDGVHLTDAGAAAYADVLVRNLLGYGVDLVTSDLGASSSSSLN